MTAVALLGPGGVPLLAMAPLSALAVAKWAEARIGGATGDVYGATCELTETMVLIAMVAAQSHGWLEPWLFA